MIAADCPRSAHKRRPMFTHFTRGKSEKHVTFAQNSKAYNDATPASLAHMISLETPDSTPPLSPASDGSSASLSSLSSKNDSVLDLRPTASHRRVDSGISFERRSPTIAHWDQPPRLTKDKTKRTNVSPILIEPFEVPVFVRNRPSRKLKALSRPPIRAQPSSLPTRSFTSEPRIAPWTLYLPPSQVYALYMGFLPDAVENTWFIYSEGPDPMGKLKVHFHRSLTRTKIVELFVVVDIKGEGAGRIVGVKWDEKCKGDSRMASHEAKRLVRTTAQSVLGITLEDESV